MSHPVKVVSLSLAAFVVAACATIMHGTSQDISISSQPTGATVSVDGNAVGTTPVAARLSRKSTHRVQITMAGYRPFEMMTTRKTSGWVWGNLVFGGLIGLAVDAATGGLYDVKPEQIAAELAAAGVSGTIRDGNLYVILVAEPNPSWRKIGQLAPAL